ncbi:MAG: type II toxin-antitoxin system RelE/ParE family toxin [Phormidesmis sp.]
MLEVRTTAVFSKWFRKLKDREAKIRIQARLDQLELNNFGDVAPVGQGVSELRINYGPGYRLYFVKQGSTIVVLLLGGDKDSQTIDIKKAKKLAKELED